MFLVNFLKTLKDSIMIEITEQNFDEVMNSGKPVVLDFGATWCGPCRSIAPYLEKMSENYADQVIVAKVDVDECGDVAAKFGIRNVPTVIYLKDGEVKERIVGAVAESKLVDTLKSIL